MKNRTNNIKMRLRMAWSSYRLTYRSFILCVFILTGIQTGLLSQEDKYTKPSWWFGIAAAANVNFYQGTTQELNSGLTVPAAFHHGNGIGLYLAPLVEFHKPDTKLGVMLQVGYDNRRGSFEQVNTPCNCPADLSNDLSYLTIEPNLRFAPFKSNFYLYGGPRLAINLAKSFTYKQGINPAYPEQIANPDVKGDFSNVNKTLISMQIGAGYDIPISSRAHKTQYVISPFVSFHPYIGNYPRSIETWNVTTLRAGLTFKLGQGHKISAPAEVLVSEPDVRFSVISPKNIPVDRRVRETFPIRNYVFFDLGSTKIPDRYVLLKKEQVKEFKEDQLEVFTPKKLSGRSAREMIVYYNILNILGDRMGKNPSSTIVLVGSSEKGTEDGKAMAESIKQYLVEIFGINAKRISIEGRVKPKIPSEKPGGTLELDLLREGDQRVSIESSSPVLIMEFQSGQSAPLKPVEIVALQQAPIDSYVSFIVEGATNAFTSWSLEIKNKEGEIQNYGPYTKEKVSMPGKVILGSRPDGDYKVTMVGKTKNGNIVRKEKSVHMVLWTPSENEQGMRYRIIYEFNESKAILIYEKYLTDIVTPKIPKGGTVIIHGYTDIIGDEANNKKLSIDRANDVRNIIEASLTKAGRSDVTFEVYGFGEDESLSPFENKYPEEHFYNRTVIIDIIPHR